MSYSMETVTTDVRDFVLTRKQRTPSQAGIQARYHSQANCCLSKPVELEAFEGLVKSINNFRLTKARLPEHGSGSCA